MYAALGLAAPTPSSGRDVARWVPTVEPPPGGGARIAGLRAPRTSPVNSRDVPMLSIPEVPSNTCTALCKVIEEPIKRLA